MDIKQILNDMVTVANDTVKDDVGEIKEYAKQIVANEKDSLQELGQARIQGQIDDETFDGEVERQKKVIEAEMLTIQVMTKSAAQKAVNAAMVTFKEAVKALI